MAYTRIIQLLTEQNVSFTVHEHDAVRTIEDAEEKAPHLVKNLIKTVAFRIKDACWVLAAVRCADRIDYRKLAKVLGVNRRQLRSLSPEQVYEELHFEVGGVGPFPVRDDVRTIFDSHLRGSGVICCGSGKNTRTLELDFADLLRVADGETHAIVREDSDAPPRNKLRGNFDEA